MSNNQDNQNVVTGRVRLSYTHLFAPYAHQQGAEPKYSTTILVPKSDIATKQRIDAAINTTIQEGIQSKWNGVRPPVLAIPVYDGDGVRPSDGMPFGDECKGNWVFTASSKQAPEVVDINLNPIIDQTQVYSGMYARVSVRFFPYASNGKKGVGCGLGPVQKLDDGEPLSGHMSAASAFGDSANLAPATPTYTPQTFQPTPQPQMYQQQGQQPMYQQQPAYQQPIQQPVYPQQQQQVQVDPITGRPMSGGVMGI